MFVCYWLHFYSPFMVKKMFKELDKAYKEIETFVEESRSAKIRINFKRKQLQFLKADVKKHKLPFKIGLKKIEAKKRRRIENVQKKQILENYKK